MSFFSIRRAFFAFITLVLALVSWPGPAVADQGLCINWYRAFGLPNATYRRTPDGPLQNMSPQVATVTGRITRLHVGTLDSKEGQPSEFNQIHITRGYRYNKYGREVNGQVFVVLTSNLNQTFALRLLNEGNCGPSESAKFSVLLDAAAREQAVTITYLTVAPFEYAWDSDDDGFVFNTHNWTNGMILQVEQTRVYRTLWEVIASLFGS